MSIKMRSTAAENGILKVVHPGRHVEILRDPITAGEVMMRNPRHRVTRPDIFKFPWIVIKPESVLPLGKVFYLVPERTLYDLMKSEMNRNYRSSQPEPSRKIPGMTPKHPRTEQRPTQKGDVGGNFDRGLSSLNRRRQGNGGRGGATVVPLKSKGDVGGNFDRGPSSLNRRRQGNGGRGGAAVVPLKSCMTKPESDRKSHVLQVTFRDHKTRVVSRSFIS